MDERGPGFVTGRAAGPGVGRLLSAVLLAASLAAAAGAGSERPLSASEPTSLSPVPRVGSASVALAPRDSVRLVRLDLVVEATETTATGAASAARFRIRTVLGALGQSGVELTEIFVGDLELTQLVRSSLLHSNRRPPPPPRVRGYRARVPITVFTPALHRADFLVDRAAGAGAYLEGLGYETVPVVEKPSKRPGYAPSRDEEAGAGRASAAPEARSGPSRGGASRDPARRDP